MTGSRGFSHLSASGTASNFGVSIAGMPSLGGPPDMISLNGTPCFVKSVFHSEVSKGIRWPRAQEPVADTSAVIATAATIRTGDFTVPPLAASLRCLAVRDPHVFLQSGLGVEFLTGVGAHDALLFTVRLHLMPCQLFLSCKIQAAAGELRHADPSRSEMYLHRRSGG